MVNFSSMESLEASIGKPLGKSRWFDIDQMRINAFGQVTEDLDAMHMDQDWASAHSPFGQTIAHGFHTLSLLSAMINDILPRASDETYKLNYGFDRIRFISPVKEGSRVRGEAKLIDVRVRPDGAKIISIEVSVEIEGEEKPALVATWLFMFASNIEGQ